MSSDALLWSLSETTRQLGGLSVRTVRRMLVRGELPTVKVGRTVKIPASAVREWVDRNMARRLILPATRLCVARIFAQKKL